MEAIFASMLYKASKNKSKIRAAISDPINKELVQQLSEYLDEPIADVPDADPAQEVPEEAKKHGTSGAPTPKDRTIMRHGGAPSKSDHLADLEDRLSDADNLESEPSEDSSTEDIASPDTVEEPEELTKEVENSDEEESAESSKVVTGSNVFAGKCIAAEVLPKAVEEIKGTLNHTADTAGVNRAIVKDSELWIYYNDNVNLNNVMGPAIELLNATNYYYLEFNRLARSDNAIVFQVSFSDTNTEMDPMNGADDEKE